MEHVAGLLHGERLQPGRSLPEMPLSGQCHRPPAAAAPTRCGHGHAPPDNVTATGRLFDVINAIGQRHQLPLPLANTLAVGQCFAIAVPLAPAEANADAAVAAAAAAAPGIDANAAECRGGNYDANGQRRRWRHQCRPQELPLAGDAAQHTQAVLRQRKAHSGKPTQREISRN